MQNKSVLRPFTKQDMDALYFLTLRTFELQPDQGVYRALKKHITDQGTGAVVLTTPDSEYAVDGALLVQDNGGEKPFKLCCVMVDPAMQRRRLGTLLVSCALQMAAGLRRTVLEAVIHADDCIAGALLAKVGFKNTHEEGRLFPNQEAGCLWRLPVFNDR